MKALLVIFVFALFCLHDGGAMQYDELCGLFKNGIQLRKPGTCNEYLKCVDGAALPYSCPGTQFYDRNKQTCSNDDKLAEEPYCGNRCKGQKGKWVVDPTDCRGFFYCNSEDEATQGYCDSGYNFNENTQMCEFAASTLCLGVSNVCDVAPDNSVYRFKEDCTIYYKCKNFKSTKTTCRNMYFDLNKGECDEKALVECKAPLRPKNVCGTATTPKVGFQTDAATCRGFFLCEDLKGVPDLEPQFGQCPVGTFFRAADTRKKIPAACDLPINVKCTFNRCVGRGNMMVTSSNNNCHNYFLCKDNRQVGAERTCNNDMFFDEKSQACVKTIIYDKCCDIPPK